MNKFKISWQAASLLLSGCFGAISMLLLGVFLALPLAILICPLLSLSGNLCNWDMHGPYFITIGSFIVGSIVGTFSLRLLTKLPWLVGIETAITSLTLFLYFWTNQETLGIGLIISIIAFVIHGFVFTSLARWRLAGIIISLMLSIIYLGISSFKL